MSPCAIPGQLFPCLPPRITTFLNIVVYTAACSSNLFEFLIRIKFTRWCLRRRYVWQGVLERKKKTQKKNCTISVLHLRSSLLELAAQEELARFYKSFWCSSHHLYQEEEWWSSVLQHDTDSDCSLKREHGTGRLGPGRWLPLNLALVKRKVKNSKLRNAVLLCLIYFTPYILTWAHIFINVNMH